MLFFFKKKKKNGEGRNEGTVPENTCQFAYFVSWFVLNQGRSTAPISKFKTKHDTKWAKLAYVSGTVPSSLPFLFFFFCFKKTTYKNM